MGGRTLAGVVVEEGEKAFVDLGRRHRLPVVRRGVGLLLYHFHRDLVLQLPGSEVGGARLQDELVGAGGLEVATDQGHLESRRVALDGGPNARQLDRDDVRLGPQDTGLHVDLGRVHAQVVGRVQLRALNGDGQVAAKLGHTHLAVRGGLRGADAFLQVLGLLLVLALLVLDVRLQLLVQFEFLLERGQDLLVLVPPEVLVHLRGLHRLLVLELALLLVRVAHGRDLLAGALLQLVQLALQGLSLVGSTRRFEHGSSLSVEWVELRPFVELEEDLLPILEPEAARVRRLILAADGQGAAVLARVEEVVAVDHGPQLLAQLLLLLALGKLLGGLQGPAVQKRQP
mmetsp:Transcript_4589/g.11233  ORF Transcript_4589/g.11233 Transcript_4589/m.11233 type:complete len:343 (-) Transcript_4589:1990-3018(-)